MVPVATAGSSFEARVIAARLGAEGIVWQFRGTLDGPLGPLPGGEVTVLVVEDDYEAARELLLADEIDAIELGRGPAPDGSAPRAGRWWIVAGLALVIVFTVARLGSLL
jgi:Putative prokaryotic signal transducing protein